MRCVYKVSLAIVFANWWALDSVNLQKFRIFAYLEIRYIFRYPVAGGPDIDQEHGPTKNET